MPAREGRSAGESPEDPMSDVKILNDGERTDGPSGSERPPSGAQVAMRSRTPNQASAKEAAQLPEASPGQASGPPGGDEAEAEPEAADQAATRLLAVCRDRDRGSPEAGEQEPPEPAKSSRRGLGGALAGSAPRIAGGDESTRYFQVPGTTSGSAREDDASPGRRSRDQDAARSPGSFTQLLESASSGDDLAVWELSELRSRGGSRREGRESAHRDWLEALKARQEPQGDLSSLPGERTHGARGTAPAAPDRDLSPAGSSTRPSGGRLHALVPWLLLLDLAMTTLVLIALVFLLLHLPMPLPGYQPMRSW